MQSFEKKRNEFNKLNVNHLYTKSNLIKFFQAEVLRDGIRGLRRQRLRLRVLPGSSGSNKL